jgi:hypothetical protein
MGNDLPVTLCAARVLDPPSRLFDERVELRAIDAVARHQRPNASEGSRQMCSMIFFSSLAIIGYTGPTARIFPQPPLFSRAAG